MDEITDSNALVDDLAQSADRQRRKPLAPPRKQTPIR
jgi:hypothetical protein